MNSSLELVEFEATLPAPRIGVFDSEVGGPTILRALRPTRRWSTSAMWRVRPMAIGRRRMWSREFRRSWVGLPSRALR